MVSTTKCIKNITIRQGSVGSNNRVTICFKYFDRIFQCLSIVKHHDTIIIHIRVILVNFIKHTFKKRIIET